MPHPTINDLLACEGRDFLVKAYQLVLKRDPDPVGLDHYLRALESGKSKKSIVRDLATSREARTQRVDLPPALEDLARGKARLRFPLPFFRNKCAMQIESLGGDVAALQALLLPLSDNVSALCKTVEEVCTLIREQHTSYVEGAHPIPQKTGISSQTAERTPSSLPLLTPTQVRNAFLAVLGREPENDEVISHHSSFPSEKILCCALTRTPEYMSKRNTLPYAAQTVLDELLGAIPSGGSECV